jgi:hypothetical protein
MKKQDINNYIYLTVVAIAIYLGYDVIMNFLKSTNLIKTKEQTETTGKVKVSVGAITSEIAKIEKVKTDPKATAQQKLVSTPTYSNAYYLQLADKLYEAFNHVGTNTSIIKSTMALMKKRLDVLKLISAYGVRQTYVFGLKDGEPSNLIGHLVSENAVDDANEGLQVNKVYYTF